MKFTAPLITLGLLCSTLVEAGRLHSLSKRSTANQDARGFIVQFHENNGVGKAAPMDLHSRFVSSLTSKGHNVETRQTFRSDLLNGISVNIDTHEALSEILNDPRVSDVYPIVIYKRPQVTKVNVQNNGPDLYFTHNLTQVNEVHNKLGFTGKGIKVGVIDSGVYYLHPALGGGFGKGHKVAYGYDLVGDKFDGIHLNTLKPSPDPLDNCGAHGYPNAEGHGTHVSGIIAARDHVKNFVGVAPDATLGMWRIFGCDGGSPNDIIIKGMEMAYEAGMDVINLSLGGDSGWEEDPGSVFADKLVGLGKNVVIAMGNDGSGGILLASGPGSGRRVLAAASFDNLALLANGLTVSTLPSVIAYLGSTIPLTLKNAAVVSTSDTTTEVQDGCNAITQSLTGKIALIQRGTCSFATKAGNAQVAGAIAVIIYTRAGQPAMAPGVTGGPVNITIPVVGISHNDGVSIFNTLSKNPTISFGDVSTVVAIPTAGTVSDFSTWGPTNELQLKPNLGGIGGSVFSTLPHYLGDYGTYSGTSMATPYISGSIALLLQAKGRHNGAAYITEIFQNYAKPSVVYNTSYIDNPIHQGAGLIQVFDAIEAVTHVSPAELSFNDTKHHIKSQTITVTNTGKKQTTYQLAHLPALAAAGFNPDQAGFTPIEPAGYDTPAATVHFSSKVVTLKPGQSAKVQVTVYPPKLNHTYHEIYGGYLVVAPQGASFKPVHIPYIGMVGNMHDLPIFDTANGYPVIQNPDSSLLGPKDTGIYSMEGSDFPVIVARLLTGTAHIKIEIVNSQAKKVVGSLANNPMYDSPSDWLVRNTMESIQGDSVNTTWVWDGRAIPVGKTKPIDVPNGIYHVVVSALKVFGDIKNSKDWVHWLSPRIQVKRN